MACPVSAANNGDMPAGHPVVEEKVAEVAIPQPPPSFLLGNLPEMDPNFPSKSIQRMADLYGEIYQLQFPGRRVVVLSSERLIDEVCNQDRFFKEPAKVLREVRALTGDGLFTSAHEDGRVLKTEKNWWKAHRLLVPAFGPLGLRKMADDMIDISAQMMLRWDRLGEQHVIDCSDDFTRLAFDTIGLCSFGYRFNEFYSDEAHPFAKQMAEVLKMSGRRANRTDLQNMLHHWEEQERQENVKAMHGLVNEIIAERKKNKKPDAKDLLNTMLYAVDRETGETLSEENVAYNMVTFLVAGHETTSATLSFMWYNLLKNPEAFHKAQQQVDEVVGDNVVTLDMIPKLTYIDACIKETLRLNSPIAGFGLTPKKATFLAGGKYRIKEDDSISVNLKGLHTDPAVWGEDHNEFKPERFLDGGFQALPPNSWKPFGNGLRACIGRGFAEQEMMLNTAMILQRFQPSMVDPSYDLQIKSTLTIKPTDFYIRVRRRPGKSLLTGIPGGAAQSPAAQKQQAEEEKSKHSAASGVEKKVKIFYGGNSGTCEGFSQALATTLSERDVQADIAGLDAAAEGLSKEAVNFIVTASYEGQPPDNAKKFVTWLEQLDGAETLQGVRYSVMGVGNSDWASTFHRIPKLIDEKMSALGAKSVVPAAYSNVKADLIGPFEDWSDAAVKHLTSAAGSQAEDDKPSIKVSIERSALAKQLGDDKMGVGTVLKNVELADTSVGPAKMHMEVRLPEGMKYEAGDYLVVQPRNPDEAVNRVMRFFGYDEQTKISIEGSKKKFLPSTPTPIDAFLHLNVELSFPVTKRQLKTISSYAKDGAGDSLLDDAVITNLIEKRYTIVEVLFEKSIPLPFEIYLDMLQPLTPRQYSISSSPLAPNAETVASITYDIHTSPALSGHGIFQGAASTFLASRKPGDTISCFIRTTNVGFRLPADTQTPVVMFSAGTGIAPMRAFLQERAAIATAGSRTLGPSLLFFGSRDAEKDFLYKSELAAWEAQGIVKVYGAHSRMPGAGTDGKPKYVQDAIWAEKDQVAKLFAQGGKIYLCGSAARLGRSCAEVSKKIYREKTGKGEEEAEEWLVGVKTDRYVSDVY